MPVELLVPVVIFVLGVIDCFSGGEIIKVLMKSLYLSMKNTNAATETTMLEITGVQSLAPKSIAIQIARLPNKLCIKRNL